MSYNSRGGHGYGSQSRRGSGARGFSKNKKDKKESVLKELGKYTTLTPEGRAEFAKTVTELGLL